MTVHIHARVARGRGWAGTRFRDDAATLPYHEGRPFVAGSLNLVTRHPIWLDAARASYRTRQLLFWPATMNGMAIFMSRWVPKCPAHVFEIYATTHLRSRFGLADGDPVELEFAEELVAPMSTRLLNRIVWTLIWRYREKQIYRDGAYLALSQRAWVARRVWRSFQRG